MQIPSDVVPGNYFLGAIADIDGEVPAEGSETNNAASTPILIAQPDLVVTVLTAPATAGAGLTITVSSTVKNQATAAVSAGASTLAFYLSADTTFDPATSGWQRRGPSERWPRTRSRPARRRSPSRPRPRRDPTS